MKNNLIILKNSVMKQPLLFIVIAIAAVVSVAAIVGISSNTKMKKVDATELAQFEAWKETKTLEALETEKASYVVPKTTTRSTSAKRTVNYQSPKMVSESQNAAKTTTTKKGWSKAAKATAIGAGAGAVLGAVINKKNRAVGAVIGGVIGGGGGYVIGRGMDKKDGRY
jgi:preprotein translocase subunit SecF